MALEHILPPPLPPLLSFPLLLGSSIAPPSWSNDDCFDRTRLNKTVCLIGRQGRQGTHERHGRHSRQWTRVITDQGEKSFVEELYTSTFHLVFPRPAFPKESIRGLGWREAPSCPHSGSPLSLDWSSCWKMEDTQEDIDQPGWLFLPPDDGCPVSPLRLLFIVPTFSPSSSSHTSPSQVHTLPPPPPLPLFLPPATFQPAPPRGVSCP